MQNIDEAIVVAELIVENWPPDFRDSLTRMYDGKVVAFAGDMSYGDEPDGSGYKVLKDICMSGIMEELGFE